MSKAEIEQIRETTDVTARLKARECVEVWHDRRLKIGDLVMVSALYREGPGYEAKVTRVFDEGRNIGGTHLWRYYIEPTGRVVETVPYYN